MPAEPGWIGSLLASDRGASDGTSDLEALHARKDIRLLPLKRGDRTLLEDLPSLGRVDCTTRNACVTCSQREAVTGILPLGEGATLFGESEGLRWLEGSWRHTVAVLNRSLDFTGTPPCLLLFGEAGDLAHQITLPDPAAWEAFISLVCRHHGCWDCLRHPPAEPGPAVGLRAECPVWMLREAWSGAGSEQDLDARLEGLGLDRLLALRAMEGLHTALHTPRDLAALLAGLAVSGLPVHATAGNRHCTEVLAGPLEDLSLGPGPWAMHLGSATLTLDPDHLESVWSVALPGRDAERHRLECYDAAGARVLTLASPGDPEPAVRLGWQRLLNRLEGGTSC